MQKLISVVIPAFNEEACVDELSSRLAAVADTLRERYAFEFVIVENGSIDSTYQRLLAIHDRDARFKIIRLSRNFGMEGGVTAGLQAANGDATIIMCADLQDPPELIPEFLSKWEAGYEMVYGEITRRSDEGWLRQRLTSVFYWLLNRATTHRVPRNVSDFRLVSKKMYQTLNRLPERHRMLRSMWGWVGFSSIGVPYGRPPRHAGKSTYQLFRNIGFGLHGIAVSSIAPLKLIPYAGFTLAALSFGSLIVLGLRWMVFGVPFDGFGTIVSLQLGLFGLLFLLMGVMGEYIGMIFEEVRGRPHYIVDTHHGFDTPSIHMHTASTVSEDMARVLPAARM